MPTSDVNYWNNDAINYDTRLKKSQNAYEKLITNIKQTVSKEMLLLDIGTGTGEIPINISKHVKHIKAIDYSPEMIKIAKNKAERFGITNVSFQVQGIDQFSEKSTTFDVVTIINVLHVVPKPEEVLNEAKKRVTPGGKIIIATYLHNENFASRIISNIMKRKGHPIVTRFTSKTIGRFLENSSLNIVFQEKIPNIMPIMYVVAQNKTS